MSDLPRVQMPEGNPAVQESLRIAQANGGRLGLTREQAIEVLKARGVHPPGDDGKPTYRPVVTTESIYPTGGPITPDQFAKVQMPALTASVITDELKTAGQVDPASVEATYANSTTSTYAKDTADAQILLDASGSKLRATALPARSLRLIANWARGVSSRPKP